MIFPKPKKLECDKYFSFAGEISLRLVSCEGLSEEPFFTVFGESSEDGVLEVSASADASLSDISDEACRMLFREKDGKLCGN